VYNILFRASSEALQKLAGDPRLVGGRIGMVGVLHTWTRDLRYHPHVHYVVTGGGLDSEGRWRHCRNEYLAPGKPLGIIFRAKVRDALKKAGLLNEVDSGVWKKEWVIDLEPVGTGEAAFKYLAPYIFRVAISNNRILKLEEGKVTFKYKDSATDRVRISTPRAEEFIRRFLQHVLPERFVKVRYYGLLSAANRRLLERAREQLGSNAGETGGRSAETAGEDSVVKEAKDTPRCPTCGSVLIMVRRLRAKGREPP
jgi:hypothetical protein